MLVNSHLKLLMTIACHWNWCWTSYYPYTYLKWFSWITYQETSNYCSTFAYEIKITSCWGLFFGPTWHYFIGNPCHINILLIFCVNLFKTQNKLISYSTTWIGLTWLARSLFQETNSWSIFPLHQIRIITLRHYQHQHMDWA